jgi:hypothetical protein
MRWRNSIIAAFALGGVTVSTLGAAASGDPIRASRGHGHDRLGPGVRDSRIDHRFALRAGRVEPARRPAGDSLRAARSRSVGIPAQTVSFTLDGVPVGTAVTNSATAISLAAPAPEDRNCVQRDAGVSHRLRYQHRPDRADGQDHRTIESCRLRRQGARGQMRRDGRRVRRRVVRTNAEANEADAWVGREDHGDGD